MITSQRPSAHERQDNDNDVYQFATRVEEWTAEIDAPVWLFVVHPNARYERTLIDRMRWQGWCAGYWTDFNGGGWVWAGHCGRVTHVRPRSQADE